MDGETKKRGREEGEEKTLMYEDERCFAMKTAKALKQDQQQHYYKQDARQEEESDESQTSSCDGKYVGLGLGLGGVFDFPWLHEHDNNKSDEEEYWNFQDTFSSSLHAHTCPPSPCLYETPTTKMKLEDMDINVNVWPLEAEAGNEMESVDCIWSWMLNQPPASRLH